MDKKLIDDHAEMEGELKNYHQMLRDYRQECREFWLKEFPLIAVLYGSIIFGATYAMSRFPRSPGEGEPILPWWMRAAIWLIPVLFLLAKALLPPKPS